jgi:hypothetical protein
MESAADLNLVFAIYRVSDLLLAYLLIKQSNEETLAILPLTSLGC